MQHLFENRRREFHFCRHEIDYTTFASAFFCRREMIWVRKTEYVMYIWSYLNFVFVLQVFGKFYEDLIRFHLLRWNCDQGIITILSKIRISSNASDLALEKCWHQEYLRKFLRWHNTVKFSNINCVMTKLFFGWRGLN